MRVWRFIVFDVQEVHHGLMHRFHLLPTKKNHKNYWTIFKSVRDQNLQRLTTELNDVGLKFGILEVENKPKPKIPLAVTAKHGTIIYTNKYRRR